MNTSNSLIAAVTFENKRIRRHWNEQEEKWYFAVVDVVAALSGSENPTVDRRVLKKCLLDVWSDQTVTKCNAFKLQAADREMRLTVMADTQTMFRIIQSIPFPAPLSGSGVIASI